MVIKLRFVMPRNNGRMMLYNLITKKKAYEKGYADAIRDMKGVNA